MRMLRLEPMLDRSGLKRTPAYRLMREGLWPCGVKLGPRMVAWPESEVDAVLGARVAGQTDEQVRTLVQRLHAARAHGAAA